MIDEIECYLCIYYAFLTYLFLNFAAIFRLHDISVSFFKLSQITQQNNKISTYKWTYRAQNCVAQGLTLYKCMHGFINVYL